MWGRGRRKANEFIALLKPRLMAKIPEVVSEMMLSDGDQVQKIQDDGEMQDEGGSEREVSSESEDGGSEISECWIRDFIEP